LSSSITATMCWRQMSGMSRLSDDLGNRGREAHRDARDLIGLERLLAADLIERIERALDRGEPTVHFLMSVPAILVALAEFFDELPVAAFGA